MSSNLVLVINPMLYYPLSRNLQGGAAVTDIRILTDQEKMFLAGSVKNMILADGQIDEEEIRDLNKITQEMHFTDFEEALEDFEAQVLDQETYWLLAEKITKKETQDLILGVLYELSVQEGYSKGPQNKLLDRLKELWGND